MLREFHQALYIFIIEKIIFAAYSLDFYCKDVAKCYLEYHRQNVFL